VAEVYDWLKECHDKETTLCDNARLWGAIHDDCTFCSCPCPAEIEKREKARALRY
jgi:hypothetical protein